MRYLILLGAVGAAIVGYTVYWFSLAGRFEDGVAAWITTAESQGMTVGYDDISVAGYPFRLVADIRGLDWRFPARDGSLDWRAERVRLVTEPWRKGHVIVLFDGQQTLAREDGDETHRYVINAGSARASLVTQVAGAARFAFVAEKLDILASDSGKRLEVESAQMYLRDIPSSKGPPGDAEENTDPSLPPTAQIDFMVAGVTLPEGKGGALGRQLSELQGQAVINGKISGLNFDQLQAWANIGGTVDITGLTTNWGSLVMESAGTLTLDEANRPLGAFEGRFQGTEGILGAIENLGTPRPESMRLARSALDAMASGRKGEWVTVPFTMQNGFLYMGSIPLATLEPVREAEDQPETE